MLVSDRARWMIVEHSLPIVIGCFVPVGGSTTAGWAFACELAAPASASASASTSASASAGELPCISTVVLGSAVAAAAM